MKTVKVRAKGPALFFGLEDINGERAERVFRVGSDRITTIPIHYAKSLYNHEVLLEWIRTGKLIIVEGKEQLEETLIEENYINEKITPVNHAELLNIMKGNNVTRIKELFEGPNKEIALELASTHRKEIPQGIITYIEGQTGISLNND